RAAARRSRADHAAGGRPSAADSRHRVVLRGQPQEPALPDRAARADRAGSLAARPAERPVHESAGNARRLGITDRPRPGAGRRVWARRRGGSGRHGVGTARGTPRPRPRARAATGAGAALGLRPAPGGARRGLCPTTSLWDTRMIAPVLALIGWTFVMWFWM